MPTIVKRQRLSKLQKAFTSNPARFRAFCGGRGIGKTYIGSYDIIRRAKPRRTYLVGSPTGVMMQDTTFPTFKVVAGEDGLDVIDDIKLSPYPNVILKNKATIRFRTADDPERLRGPNLSGAWLDEGSLMIQGAYDIAIAALREGGEMGWLSSTFTPKGKLHWTYEVFGTGRPDTALVTGSTKQNPFLPPEFYETIKRQYGEDSVFAQQELGGLFVDGTGLLFQIHWFRIVDVAPKVTKMVRFWDLAATVPKIKKGEDRTMTDPDWTAGVLLGKTVDKEYVMMDVRRMRGSPLEVEQLVRATAEQDGHDTEIWMEQEPGSSGVAVIDHYLRHVLAGYNFHGKPSTGDKYDRMRPLAAMAQAGHVMLLRSPWNKQALDEAEGIPYAPHDDVWDAAAGGFNQIAERLLKFNLFA